jgi:hypothetical protein
VRAIGADRAPSDAASSSSAAAPFLRRMSAASSASAMTRLIFFRWSATGPSGNASTGGFDRRVLLLGCSGEDGGKQVGRGRAGDLGRGRRSGRRPDDQIGLGHVQSGIEQAGDDADKPRVACGSAAAEDQRTFARGRHPPHGVDLRMG